MIERIQLILQTKSLSPGKFADEIGVQRSSVSHILSGRNGPSLDFIQKILKRYTDISATWLVSGEGQMYPGNQVMNAMKGKASSRTTMPDLFSLETSGEEPAPDMPVLEPRRTVKPEKKHIEPSVQSPVLPAAISDPGLPEPPGAEPERVEPAALPMQEEAGSKQNESAISKVGNENKSPAISTDQAVKALLFYPDGTFEVYNLRR
jgi:transcriptional regulator with XRE-family HTH domain